MGLGPEHLPENSEEADRLWEEIKPLVEGLDEPDGESKKENEIAKAKALGFVEGAKVKMSYDDKNEIGKVVGYNQSTGGFYPSSRYPVLVKFERGTFEYGLESLELVESE